MFANFFLGVSRGLIQWYGNGTGEFVRFLANMNGLGRKFHDVGLWLTAEVKLFGSAEIRALNSADIHALGQIRNR